MKIKERKKEKKKRFTVSEPEEIFGQPEYEECPRDKRHCTGLAERLSSDLFQQRCTKASPPI
jgi:hypothetical protein